MNGKTQASMKEWFKYEFGYVNIDTDNVYLTNTGNWSETVNLPEKTKKVANKNDNRRSSILGFIIIFVGILGFLTLNRLLAGGTALFLSFVGIGGGFGVYNYLKTEIGARYKIPKSKITAIKTADKTVEIFFIDGEGKNGSYKLYRVDEKGMQLTSLLSATE